MYGIDFTIKDPDLETEDFHETFHIPTFCMKTVYEKVESRIGQRVQLLLGREPLDRHDADTSSSWTWKLIRDMGNTLCVFREGNEKAVQEFGEASVHSLALTPKEHAESYMSGFARGLSQMLEFETKLRSQN